MAVTTAHRWSLLAALLYGSAALSFSVAMGFVDEPSMLPLVVSAVLSAAILGGGSWYLLVEGESRRPVAGGIASGLLTGILSHFLMWALSIAVGLVASPSVVVGTVVLGFASLLLSGLVTTPIAVLVGGGLGLVRRRRGTDA